ncbi:MAG: hypothetical protein H6685_00430 [Deltaproteobacteria bacterium]|nr:hypothetical protein [Deltaproteobacteria bacterium]
MIAFQANIVRIRITVVITRRIDQATVTGCVVVISIVVRVVIISRIVIRYVIVRRVVIRFVIAIIRIIIENIVIAFTANTCHKVIAAVGIRTVEPRRTEAARACRYAFRD